MGLTPRSQRWPSAWQTPVDFRQAGHMIVEIRNISDSGMRCIAERPVKAGDSAQLLVMGRPVSAQVLRVDGTVTALVFDTGLTATQLANLRQFRRLSALPSD